MGPNRHAKALQVSLPVTKPRFPAGVKVSLLGPERGSSRCVSFGGTGKGGLGRQGLLSCAYALGSSLMGLCHNHSAAVKLPLAQGACCSVVFVERAVEGAPAWSSTFPHREGASMCKYRQTCTCSRTPVWNHAQICAPTCTHTNPACPQAHTRKEHVPKHEHLWTQLRKCW